MTYDLAMAASKDAANRQMRSEGRTRWSRKDYALAVRTFNRLFPERVEKAQMRQRFSRL